MGVCGGCGSVAGCTCGTRVCVAHPCGGCSPALPSHPESWGRKKAIPFGCNPCPYNAREGIIPGINILNSPSRPTQSKILRPVIVFLSWDYCVPDSKPQFQEKLRRGPPPMPVHPKLPGIGQNLCIWVFFPFLAILSNPPATVGRRLHECFSCRLPPPNSQ